MQSDAVAQPKSTFRLLRYFSLTSLVGVLFVLAVLLYFYRSFAFAALQDHETRGNVAITQIFTSTLWPKYASYIKSAKAINKVELQNRAEVAQLREDVLRLMAGLTVVKVKIYNLDGLTMFSTDPKQIGEDKSTNQGFLTAKAGEAASEITFRDHFDSFERVINDRNLISSYIPIRSGPSSPIEGVMEVYSDVTDYVAELQKTTWEIAAGVLASLSLLYLFLFAIVRRADTVIKAQSEEAHRAHAEMLRHQHLHDALTGLPNRRGFFERLERLIKTPRRSQLRCAVLHIGLDGLKDINNSLGHLAGDQVLMEAAKRLQASMRASDLVARIAGDEFAIALPDVSGVRGGERVAYAAEKIRSVMSSGAYVLGDENLTLTASIGIAIHPEDGADVPELTKSADTALHHAKRVGRNSYQFHTSDMNTRALEMLLIERDLRQGLEENQLLLHYQPQVALGSGRIIGAEALVRWRHPERGLVSPAQFIPIAEERGLIARIEEWVLREACQQNKKWQEAGLPKITVAVNLSALQFQKDTLSQEIARVLQGCGLAPDYLELELTESTILGDASKAITAMHSLKGIGVTLSLDDFGTGYSSLSQLKRLPLDKLKIDQSFVRGLPHDPDDLAISQAIIAMAKTLKRRVIAEGVETSAQKEVLQSFGCDEIQGYLIAKPLPSLDFARLFHQSIAA